MILIALRNLFQEKSRLLISIGGVAFAIILMSSLFGIYVGGIEQDARFIQSSPADIFVLRQGMDDMYHGVPLVSLADIGRLRQEKGIKELIPVISLRPAVENGDRHYNLFLSSFTPTDPKQGPWPISAGTRLISDNEIIIPTALAKKVQ
ncbi:hypothetical protein KGQ71_03165 [Patescibacteria group bacterium]|nr:hypothetical protein [Patescibacteria group bacterium]